MLVGPRAGAGCKRPSKDGACNGAAHLSYVCICIYIYIYIYIQQFTLCLA